MLSGCTVPPDSKETKLRSSDQEVSAMSRMSDITGGVEISKVPGCHLLRQMSSQ